MSPGQPSELFVYRVCLFVCLFGSHGPTTWERSGSSISTSEAGIPERLPWDPIWEDREIGCFSSSDPEKRVGSTSDLQHADQSKKWCPALKFCGSPDGFSYPSKRVW